MTTTTTTSTTTVNHAPTAERQALVDAYRRAERSLQSSNAADGAQWGREQAEREQARTRYLNATGALKAAGIPQPEPLPFW